MVMQLDRPVESDLKVGDDGVVTSDHPPILYENDFYTVSWEEDYYHGRTAKHEEGHVIDLAKDSYFVPFFGPKRSGKSLMMVFWLVKCMGLWKMPCWSNIPIKFIWHDRRGQETLYESMPLDPVSLATSKDYNHGIVAIDELPLYLNSKNAMTTKNKVLGLILQQMGKRKLSFLCTAQNPKSIDGITSWQMDIAIHCQDLSKVYPERHMTRGKSIECTMIDQSGQWTGKVYDETGIIYGPWVLHQADKLWTAYKSYEEVDILESLRPWDIDLTATRITDKANPEDIQKQLVKVIEELRNSGIMKVSTDELWSTIPGGEKIGTRTKHGAFLKALGLTKHQGTDGKRVFDLESYEGID